MLVRSLLIVGLLVLAGLSLSASVVGGGFGQSVVPVPTRPSAQAVDADAQRLDVPVHLHLPVHLPVPVHGSWDAFMQAMGS